MEKTFSTIIVRVESNIGQITLNRPDALNSINGQLIADVTAALAELEADPTVRAIVLSGEGRAFSAGFDLKESAAKNYSTTPQWRAVFEADFNFIMQFWNCSKPTIAAVHGYCLAGGLELAIACDLTVASEDAVFGEPEVRFGSGIVALIVPWIVGPKFAKEMLLTGNDRIPAARVFQMGLINEVVPAGQHLTHALKLAEDIACSAPLSVELTKRAINRSLDLRGMRESLLWGVDIGVLIEASAGPERKEFNQIRSEKGLKAAIAWRDAKYRGAEV
jgi:enoyl-CoA hydratase